MMGQGRSSSVAQAMATLLLALLCLLLNSGVSNAATYTVGGSNGWAVGVTSWPNGKKFQAGDVLVFNYSPSTHNVVQVGAAGYSGCSAPSGAKVFNSGSDRVTLSSGTTYFICSLASHCQSGMKLAVTAT
ncbi:basic blue protein-like [Ananas comosus]|uniref:Plantacyanin n=1 Tax=Ananas comosus TaxID=4615 RepID=A0A6P5F061_ANACO|nr:basic blue protein-like [Ananas comosus]